MALLFMLVGATYVVAHDHDEHGAELEGECIVCSVAALGDTKSPPNVPATIAPENISLRISFSYHSLSLFSFQRSLNPARAPPGFVPFS